MRILPCRSDRCRDRGHRLKGLFYPLAMLQSGKPYTLLRFPITSGPAGLAYNCARCKRANKIKANEFSALPRLTLKQLRDMGLAAAIEQDLVGAGFTKEQIGQLDGALSVEEILENR